MIRVEVRQGIKSDFKNNQLVIKNKYLVTNYIIAVSTGDLKTILNLNFISVRRRTITAFFYIIFAISGVISSMGKQSVIFNT